MFLALIVVRWGLKVRSRYADRPKVCEALFYAPLEVSSEVAHSLEFLQDWIVEGAQSLLR